MSMSKVVIDALNQQINNELTASYEYLAMSGWCEGQTLQGSAKWLRLQSQEEYGHAMKLLRLRPRPRRPRGVEGAAGRRRRPSSRSTTSSTRC